MSKLQIALALLAILSSPISLAQVYRCPDKATGKITYSDSPCMDGKQIVRQLSDEERELDAARAALSRQRSQLDRERAAFRQEQAAQEMPVPRQTTVQPAIDPGACQKAKRELSISSNLQSGSAADKRRRMNAAIIEVNAACGTKTELIQEPVTVQVQPRTRPLICHGSGATMFCN